MSGESESQGNKAEDRLAEVNRILEDYLKARGLVARPNPEVEQILNLTKDDLDKLSPEDCGSMAYILSQTAYNIQVELNMHNMRIRWATKNLDYIAAPYLNNYGDKYTPYPVRRDLFIRENSMGQALFKISTMAQQYVDVLDNLANRLYMMTKTLLELQQTKRSA